MTGGSACHYNEGDRKMNRYTKDYLDTITSLFRMIEEQERDDIDHAAEVMADSIIKDKLIHVIGPGGHSNMASEELFWRAGGLVPINPLLAPGIQLVHGAKHSNIMERTPGYAKSVLEHYGVGAGEVILIVNAYGINAMTIDTAIEAKRMGLTTIGVTSTGFATHVPLGHPSRHPRGKNLHEIVDIFVDNHLPLGDAIVEIDGLEQKIVPCSTLLNVFTVNLIVIQTVRKLVERDYSPPIWMSANMPGGDEANKEWEQKYSGRIKHLR